MTPAQLLTAVLTYGPSVLPLIQQITAWVKEGKTEITEEDWSFLLRYANKKASDYLQ